VGVPIDPFNVFAWWHARRSKVTVEVRHALSDAPSVIDLNDIRPAPKVYRLEIVTTNHGERTEYMTSITIKAADGSASQEIVPTETSSSPIQPREPLQTEVRLDRLGFDATGLELRVIAHLTSGDVSSPPTRLDDALLAELEEHNRRAG
jgi:hypothetical protein